HFIVTLTTLLVCYAYYFSVQKIMKLRFLNSQNSIEIKYYSNFIEHFKTILEQLAHITTPVQIKHITQNFLTKNIGIPSEYISLYLRSLEHAHQKNNESWLYHYDHHTYLCVESTLTQLPTSAVLRDYLLRSKILIKDDLEFTQFYEQD